MLWSQSHWTLSVKGGIARTAYPSHRPSADNLPDALLFQSMYGQYWIKCGLYHRFPMTYTYFYINFNNSAPFVGGVFMKNV